MSNRSFSNHIATIFLVATGLLTLIMFVVIYKVVQETVYNSIDEDLYAESVEMGNNIVILSEEIIFANPSEWKEHEHGQVEVNPTFVQVLDTAGQSVKRSLNLKEENLEFRADMKERQYFDASLSNTPVRELQMPLVNQYGNTLAYLLIALPLEDSNLVLFNLRMVLAIAFPIVLIILFFFTRLIAERSIKPVNHLISETRQITPDHLEHRVSLPDSSEEIKELGNTINALLDRLQNAVLREQQFTADASHELRTPLAAIKGTLEVLIRKPRAAEQYEEKIRSSLHEVDRMAILVDQLLLLARHESGKYQIHAVPVNLKSLTEAILERKAGMASEVAPATSMDIPPAVEVFTDEGMLEIVLENILSNALKYTPANGQISISARSTDHGLQYTMSDNGPGMSREELRNVFQRFYRSQTSRHSATPGHGLGLAIVQKLCDLLQITLDFNSTKNKGTTVTLGFGAQHSVNN